MAPAPSTPVCLDHCGNIALSRKGILIAVLPAVVMLALFYSLALHMRWSLGAWPASIGVKCFPPALAAHASLAGNLYGLLVLSIPILPIPIFVCLAVKRWRRLISYLAIYAFLAYTSIILMQFAAPEQFIYWWSD